jgi:hypothetical protein
MMDASLNLPHLQAAQDTNLPPPPYAYQSGRADEPFWTVKCH